MTPKQTTFSLFAVSVVSLPECLGAGFLLMALIGGYTLRVILADLL